MGKIATHVLGNDNSIMNQFLAELRDVNIQQDGMRFRKNLVRCGEIFAYEISKILPFAEREVQTSLGAANVSTPIDFPLLATILRAGLPLHEGLLNFFDHSENAFISAYRKYEKSEEFNIEIEYASSPSVEGKVLILCDVMLATGASMFKAYKELLKNGAPKHTHFVSVLASDEGVSYMEKYAGAENATLWLGAVDDELTAQGYIVPGLGDAGDLAYGKKTD